MKTYQSPGTSNSVASKSKKIFLPLLIIIISLPAFSQELAIVKSSYQHIPSVTSWSETVRKSEGGAANWMNLSSSNSYSQKLLMEKNMEVVENSFRVALDNRRGVINWSSFQDLHTNFYIIERSVNGQPFKEIAQIFTSPDSTARFEYQYFDKFSADIKGVIYYRLKTIDGTEQPVYSPTQLASSNRSYENLLVSLKN